MKHSIERYAAVVLLCCGVIACSEVPVSSTETEPFSRGPYSVGVTNMEVSPQYSDIGDEAMHEILLGRASETGEARFVTDILKHPESAWVTNVRVPDHEALYGRASGLTLPVVTFVAFPSGARQAQTSYAFPYHEARYGVFQNMLGPGERPDFAEPDRRYPLIILAHGSEAHGIYDVGHAQALASHGYIVAVITYGDDRTVNKDEQNLHVGYLRPFLTKAVLDSLLDSEIFGANNTGLRHVDIPIICLFGTNDEATLASSILPAMKQLSGPTYVVELVDQPHIFEQGSWEDRDNWELLFFSAYLMHDPDSLETLKTSTSMKGGNEDRQLFGYQSLPPGD